MNANELKDFWKECVKLEKISGFKAVDVVMKTKIKELEREEK